ncbi:hypothetical protein [Cellulomonas sp.]|uniref:hypothetical protein n=1 Tax=Cellulomonas sp. TaxID=40001 RepID=UPI003BAB9969
MTRAEVEQLLDLVAATPPLERAAAAEELVRVADASGDDEMRFRARLELIEASFYTNGKQRMFAPFAFVVQRYDADPQWLTDDDRYRLLWVHKWMVVDLIEFPEVPLDQLRSVLEGMRGRYVAAGERLAPVLSCAYSLRAHVDGPAAAEREYLAWRRAPRTWLSDCEGCEPDQRIAHLVALGRHQEAVDELEPVVRGEVGCSEQPQRAISSALASIVELGDVETAAALHRTAYRASRRNLGETAAVARHLQVLARTGNVGRGLDLLAEQLDALDRPSSPFTGMRLAAAATRLLRTVVDAGDGDRLVRGRGRAPERAADLLVRVEAQALDTARRFDERNGTPTVGDAVRAWITAPGLPVLPLGAVGAPAATGGSVAPTIALPRVPTHPALAGLDDLDGLDLPALAALAERTRLVAHTPTHELLLAHWATRRERVLPELDGAEPAVVRAAADLEAFCVWGLLESWPGLTGSAAALYRRLGDEAAATLVVLIDDLHADRPVDAAAVLGAVDPHGTPTQRALARARLAVVASDDDADRLRAEALELLSSIDAPGDLARGLTARLRLAVGAGSVLDGLGEGEEPEVRVQLLVREAGDLAESGDLTGALEVLDRAAATARSAGAPRLILHVEGYRHRVLAQLGDEPRAEAHALALAAAAQEEGVTDLTVELRYFAAHLMARQGRDVEAIELTEATLAITYPDDAVPEPQRVHRLRYRVGLLDLASRLSSSMEEPERAVALAREAVELATRPDSPPGLAPAALLRLAGLLEEHDAVESTRLYAQALDAALADGDEATALVVRRQRVWARLDADGLDAALADVQDAASANQAAHARILADPSSAGELAEWNFEWEDAVLRTLAARVLRQAEEHQRAVDALDGVPALWEALGDRARALDAESLRGASLLGAGRDAEGLALLEDVAVRARAAGALGVSTHAAGVAATWLDEAGRPEEAEELWARHVTED